MELAASACEQLYLNLTNETEESALPIENLLKVTFTSCILQVKRIRTAGTRHHDIGLEFEEYFQNFTHRDQQILLLHHVWNYPITSLTKILQLDLHTVTDTLLSAKKKLNTLLLDKADIPKDCLSMDALIDYTEYQKDKASVVDHLEFCPTCRKRIETWNKAAAFLHSFFNPVLPFDDADKLESLVKARFKPYEKRKKKKAILKQLFALTVMIAAYFTFMNYLPELTHMKKLASNYAKHGSFYNVWDGGTYVAEDAGVKIEMTGIELTPLSAGLHFTIESSGKELVQEYTETGEQLLSKPELIFVKIGEEVHHLPHSILSSNDEKTEGTIYFNVNRLYVEEIPDEFILQFRTSRIGGVFGSWNLDIPVDFSKGSKEQTEYAPDEPVVFEDVMELEVRNFSSTDTSSLLEVKVDFTKEEKGRIERYVDALRKEADHPIEYPYLYAGYRVVNAEGEEILKADPLIPTLYGDDMAMDESAMHARHAYFPYVVEEGSNEIVRPLREGEKLYLELQNANYSEPVSLEIPIKMEEVEKAPVGLDINGTSLDYLTVRILEADGNNPERYSITLTGTQANEAFIKQFHWSLRDQGTQYLAYSANWHNYIEDLDWMEDRNTLMELEIPTSQEIPETIWVNAYYVTNHLIVDGVERIPLN
ncbi:hypothetical protein LC085_16945 [Bacillus tianshenii]|uniref:hypothetical protein n=1 Tax=Sutcliffiella tianshenii TaxID=1463404 RepID=UPI001CD549B2|nr:hypothetical protein [Bacillus tianshenii]MCA1321595.1 hypothetical protein [Bacillus tianshenii]